MNRFSKIFSLPPAASFLLPAACCLLSAGLFAQSDSSKTNQDAIYNRPFITLGKTATAVGGYVEGNTNYFSEDGMSEGFSMELRRFNIFLYSGIHERIKFISELEFEHGAEEISLETALIDFEINPALNFRGGIILPQIGLVNANHDSPKWEFVERPLSSTEIIPSTLSEIGFGVHGKFFSGSTFFSYDAYLVNGLRDNVILNDKGKTLLASGKSAEMFGEDNNGVPMYNGKISFSNRNIGEFGLSYYGGIYNTYRMEGIDVDEKRKLSVFAFDLSTDIKKLKIQGEYALVNIDVPDNLSETYGKKQYGGFVDFIYPVLKRKILKFDNSTVNVNLRLERTDYNVGVFQTTAANIGDEVSAIAGGISFRPTQGTVIRANYRYHWIYDRFGNAPVRSAGFQLGVASYF